MECQLKDLRVHYEVFGEGKPILMLPGWGADSRFMAHDFEPMLGDRSGWRRVYLDPPGHGRTPGAEWVQNQDGVLQVVLDFIDAVLPGQRLVLAGASLGAYLARGILYRRPAMIDGLLMLAPVIQAEDSRRTLPPPVVLVEDPGILDGLDPFEAELFEMVVVRTEAYLQEFRGYPQPAEGEMGDLEFLEGIRQDPERYAFSFDVDALAEPFQGPTLIVSGRQDSVVGYRDAWSILENYTRATYVVLDRAGHFLEEKQQVLHALVNEWLERVEEAASPA